MIPKIGDAKSDPITKTTCTGVWATAESGPILCLVWYNSEFWLENLRGAGGGEELVGNAGVNNNSKPITKIPL